MISKYKKLILVLVIIILIILGFLIFKILKNRELKEPKVNYLSYENLDGLYVEYPDWVKYEVGTLEKIYPKEIVEKAKSSIIAMANDSGGAQFVITQKDYLAGTTLEDILKVLEDDQKKLIPSFKILDKKINGNQVEIKSEFYLSGFNMLTFNKGFLVDIPEQGKRFYNIGITVIKNKLKDYQKIIDHIFNSAKIKNIIVFQPLENIAIRSPFWIKGRARVFENTVVIRLKDSDGKVLFEDIAMTQAPDAGLMGDFQKEISFASDKNSGILEVFWRLPKDGSELDKVSIPVKFSE